MKDSPDDLQKQKTNAIYINWSEYLTQYLEELLSSWLKGFRYVKGANDKNRNRKQNKKETTSEKQRKQDPTGSKTQCVHTHTLMEKTKTKDALEKLLPEMIFLK